MPGEATESPLEFFRNRMNSHVFRTQVLGESYRSAIVRVLLFLDCVHILFLRRRAVPLAYSIYKSLLLILG